MIGTTSVGSLFYGLFMALVMMHVSSLELSQNPDINPEYKVFSEALPRQLLSLLKEEGLIYTSEENKLHFRDSKVC